LCFFSVSPDFIRENLFECFTADAILLPGKATHRGVVLKQDLAGKKEW